MRPSVQAGDVAGGVVVLALDQGVVAVEGAGDAVIGVVGVLGAAALLVADERDVARLVVEGGDDAEAGVDGARYAPKRRARTASAGSARCARR